MDVSTQTDITTNADMGAAPPVDPAAWDNAVDAGLEEAWAKIHADEKPETGGPERGPDGRFLSKEPKAETVEQDAPVDTLKTEKTTGQPAKQEVKPETPAIQPPVSWSAEDKAKWAELPSWAQQRVAAREQEAAAKISEQGNAIKALEPVSNVLKQFQEEFERAGVDHANGIGQLLAAQRALDTDPVNAIQRLAQMYGVDLRMFGQTQEGEPEGMDIMQHPAIAQMQARLQHYEQRERDREMREARTQQQTVLEAIDAFQKDKAPEDWQELEAELVAQTTALKALNPNMPYSDILKTAWEKAQWASPKMRERIQAEQAKQREAERLEKERQEKAKKAGSVNAKTSVASSPVRKSDDEVLEEAWARAQSR